MNNKIVWAWAVKNSLCMICWTYLAIAFNKWWIALFCLLFMSNLKEQGYRRICDRCGKYSKCTDSYSAALEKAKKDGWIHYVDGDRDYCPDCIKQMNSIKD